MVTLIPMASSGVSIMSIINFGGSFLGSFSSELCTMVGRKLFFYELFALNDDEVFA
jgi:hypothetical protein